MCGLHSYWDTQTPVTEQAVIKATKLHLKESFGQHYNSLIQNNNLTKYDGFCSPTKYLSYEIPVYLRKLIAKLRLRSNRLEINQGRYTRPSVPRHERVCKSCKLEVDDEEHFVTKCHRMT